MKRLVVVALLLLVMLGLRATKIDAPGSGDPLTLAAVGFVVLAAYSLAELLAKAGLPRVTGYIASGVVLGPQLGNILSSPVVEEMSIFNTLALGLIATSAGLELDLRELGKLARSLLATLAVKLLVALPLVGGTMLLAHQVLQPFPGASFDHGVALAILFAALSLGTSPAIVLAVLNDGRAKGRLSELTLGSAIMKDVVVVVLLALAIALARPFLDTHAHLEAEVLVHVAQELGSTILAGAILGGLLLLYLRFVRREMLLFVAVMVLAVAEVSHALHLELLLVFIVAGCIVRNVSHYEHDLHEPLSLVALPVFVVFFTIAGATLNLTKMVTLLPVALALFGARALGFYGAGVLGGRLGGEAPAVQHRAWLAYLPQAGVTLGLVGIAAKALPQAGQDIKDLGMAFVALNLLVGPITLRLALSALGELGARDDEEEGDDEHDPVPFRASVADLPPNLVAERERLKNQLDDAFAAFHESGVAPWLAAWRAPREVDPLADPRDLVDPCLRLVSALRVVADDFDPTVEAPFDRTQLEARRGDSFATRLRRLAARIRRYVPGLRSAPPRPVPLRRIIRKELELPALELGEKLIEGWVETEAVLHESRLRGDDGDDPDATQRSILDAFEARVTRDLETFHDAALRRIDDDLRDAGGPSLPVRAVRQAPAATVEAARREMLRAARNAPLVLECYTDLRQATDGLGRVKDQARKVLEGDLEAVAGLGGDLAARLDAFEAEVRSGRRPADGFNELRGRGGALTEDLQGAIERLRAALEDRAEADELRQLATQELPETIQVPVAGWWLGRDRTVTTREVPLRAIVRDELVTGALPSLEASLREAASMASACATTLRQITATFSEADGETVDRTAARQHRQQLERLGLRFRDLLHRLRTALGELDATPSVWLGEVFERIEARAFARTNTGATTVADQRLRWLRHLVQRATAVVERARVARQRIINRVRGVSLHAHVAPTDVLESLRPKSDDGLDRYRRAFVVKPLRDPRLFTVRRDLLTELLELERRWLTGAPGSILLRGSFGAGRSSIVNMLEFQLEAPRVIRLGRSLYSRGQTVFDALAGELGCAATEQAIEAALRKRQTAILIDDLERWFTPTSAGLRDLRRWLVLVGDTHRRTFWIVAANERWATVHDELVPLRLAFAHERGLAALDRRETELLLRSRHDLSGRALSLPSTRAGRWLGQLAGTGQESLYFELLRRAAGGNVALSLHGWSQLANPGPRGDIELAMPGVQPFSLPQLRSLPMDTLAAVASVLIHGELSLDELRELLAIEPGDVRQHVRFLQKVSLLRALPDQRFEVPPLARPLLEVALEEAGVL